MRLFLSFEGDMKRKMGVIGHGVCPNLSKISNTRVVLCPSFFQGTVTSKGNSSVGQVDKRRQNDLLDCPGTHRDSDDRLELLAPPADLPPIFGGLHELQIRGRCEFVLRYLDL
jgi:hypothetical protein